MVPRIAILGKLFGPRGVVRRAFSVVLAGLGPRGSTVAVVLIGACWLYSEYGPQAPNIPAVRRHVGLELARSAVEHFPWDKEVGSVLMLPVQGDWGTFLTDALRRQIEDTGRFQLAPESTMRRLSKDLHLYSQASLDAQRVQNVLRDMTQDTLLVGRLRTYAEDSKEVVGELNFVFVRKGGGAPIPVHVSKRLSKGLFHAEYLLVGARLTTWGQRLFFWFLSVLVFPLLVAPITLAVTRRQKAMANLVLVAVYSFVLIAWSVVIIGPVELWWQGLTMIAVSLVIIGYMLMSSDVLASIATQPKR